ncbi:long-chain-fatty-acid--CoA ligase [Plectonema cf. radiosum LEGE 06105]|uniref:Long-chain-fatty-acid--CoA ligase n=1 Tax=Plectonema cf. radiosum LEGE 06105 TaxID=945769 RepID=A0A8J7FAA9_9CYAN|nr:long-chain-fatty-acid--CoA ligase [Plectonema radiosum]MBE9214579.1 long-chain-fatty-acid--CoA ligase [Plectonema cf. radiosum LEGE 06105]
MNIAQNVERGCCLFPNKPAVIFEGKYLTYKHLNQMVNRAANALSELGMKRGERIGLFLPNIPEFIISYLAIQKIGAIAVSINISLQEDEVKFILDDCQATVLITTPQLYEKISQADLPYLQHLLITEGKSTAGISLDELMSKVSDEARAVIMERDEPAAILYTSGTTGFPKGATLSHGNVISNMYSMNHNCGMSSKDNILLFLPMFHCFGQNAIFNSALNACATIVLHRSFEPDTIINSVAEYDITMFFGVPTTFILLLEKASKTDLTANYYFSAAAGLPVEIAKQWQEKFGQVIHQGYGLTETSPLASYNHRLKYKLGSIGTPIENVEMKIVDTENGREVTPGKLGEILIRGVNVMLGYWNRPSETAQAIKDGWFHTGDIGQMDELGYFYIVDRLKDMINCGGLKVYPAEVENVIYQHPSIAEVAVYGVPNTLMGEQVRACIVLKANQIVTEEEIIALCQQRLAQYKVPSKVLFVTSIPKNPTGKILKRLLREENSCPGEVVKVVETQLITTKASNIQQQTLKLQPGFEQVANWITDWMVKKLLLSDGKIDRNKSFADYGLDSLRAVKLAEDLSNWLQREILPTITWNFSTVDSLAHHLGSVDISQENQLDTKALLNPQSTDFEALNDRELAELLAQEIAALNI